MTTRTGDTIYGFGSNAGAVFDFAIDTSPAICIWDAGGTDTINCSSYSQTELISLIAGTFSNIGGLTANLSIALGAAIENAVGGSGSDTIIGNSASNILTGNGGNDAFTGGGGTFDWIYGNSGTDTANYTSGVGSYTFDYSVTGQYWIIVDTRGSSYDGTDFLFQMENVHFNDANGVISSTSSDASLSMALSDNTHWLRDFDLTGAQSYTQFTNHYDASSQLATQDGSYRAGGSWHAGWDVNNSQAWTSYTSNYNSSGNQTLQVGNYDDGRHWTAAFDYDFSQTWSDYTMNFDSNWVRQLQVGNYDNGNHWTEHEDSAGNQTWSSYTTNYDPNWNPTQEIGNYDDGNHWVTTWDANNHSSYVTHTYDSNWILIS